MTLPEKPIDDATPALSPDDDAAAHVAAHTAAMKAEYLRRAGQHLQQRQFFGLDDVDDEE